jgi:prepilin-type N-terminal cleavage/methylation domain-containing protein
MIMTQTMHKRRFIKQGSRGFSLAEVLVATALLSVILLALFGLVTAAVRRAYGGKKMTEATVLAQAVMERANVASPQTLIGGVDTDTSKTQTWTKSANNHLDASVTPAAETGSTTPIVERNAWRAMLRDSDVPSASAQPSTVVITMTALPAGRTFADAASVRIIVDVSWSEWGNRPRQVRLQTFNVRSTSI